MKATITNNSKALQGIWTDEGLRHIDAGKTETLTIAESYVERAMSLPFLDIVPVDPLDHDGDGEKGGAQKPEAAPDGDVEAALALLDHTDDSHWTNAGLPAVDTVEKIAGGKVTRDQINRLAPDLKRAS